MADRTVNIDLRASTSQYEREMRQASKATDGVSGSLKNIGMIAAGGAALGVAALGTAVVKVGIDAAKSFAAYETTLSQMVGLAGVARSEISGISDAVKEMAVETAQGPQKLAEAMYFIQSAGLSGATAMDALEVSAKAATAGLGDVTVVADVVTSAVNAYGASLGGASVATDVLVATVRAGKAEASELSASMGRAIPIASQMGISFDQVGAAIAAMTRTGLNAAEATTALMGIMNSLLAPSADAAKALDELGLSAAGIKAEIRDKGLFAALEHLTVAFDGNDEATTRVFGNIRALGGVMSLMGSNAEATKGIFDDLAASTGSLDTAFGATADTGAFAFEQAKTRIETALLDVGEKILPKLADAVEDIAPSIGPLIEGIGELAIGIVDLATTAVPMAVTGLEGLTAAFMNATEWGLLFQGGLKGPVDVLDWVLTPMINLRDVYDVADQRALKFIRTVKGVKESVASGVDPLDATTTALLDMVDAHTISASRMEQVRMAAGLTTEEFGAMATQLLTNWEVYGLTGAELYELTQYTEGARQAASEYRGELYGAALTTDEYASRQETLNAAVGAAPAAFAAVATPIQGVTQALKDAADAQQSLADKMLEMSDPAFKAVNARESQDRAKEALAVAEKEGNVKKIAAAQWDVYEATLRTQSALDALGFNPLDLEGTLLGMQTTLGYSRDEAVELLNILGVMDGMNIAVAVDIKANIAKGISQALIGYTGLDNLGGRAGGGPVGAGVPYMVGEQGPEMFIPNQAGTIIPNHTLTQSSSRSVTVDLRGSQFAKNVDVTSAVQSALIAGGISEDIEWVGTTTIR